jgi:hypothetical protein
MVVTSQRTRRIAAPGLLLAVLLAAAGCGSGGGAGRIAVSGKVTHQGQPVPAGSVAFEPDASRGGKGPGAVAVIKDGRYDTARDKGPTAGPHRVRINGYDGKPCTIDGTPNGMFLPEGKALFAPYETTVDLPAKGSQQDFDVPAPKPAARR